MILIDSALVALTCFSIVLVLLSLGFDD